MMASLRESVGTGTKEDELNTGRVWAVGFHHITVRSRFISLILQILSGRGKLRVTESADRPVHLYLKLFKDRKFRTAVF
jgi:hypothetical protein